MVRMRGSALSPNTRGGDRMSQGYLVPQGTQERETEVKKSRFIARAARVTTREEAIAVLERVRHDHPQARHHCWAYLLGNPDAASSAATSDAGEPAGTAGKPILGVIQHKRIGDVIVVVTRYFGGIKLGAGGLVRAYAGAAEAVLSALVLVEQVAWVGVELALDFSQEQAVRHWAQSNCAEVGSVAYGTGVTMRLCVAERHLGTLRDFCDARGIRLSTGPGTAS